MASVLDIFESMEYGPAPEGAAEAEAWLDAHGRRFDHFIGGDWRAPDAHFATENPARGTTLAEIAQGSAADVDAAVAAARAAQAGWWHIGGHARARHLYALARGLQRHARLFAVLETLDNGKPIRETRDIDIPLAARHFYHHAGWAQLLETQFPGHVPHGVAGQIIPWNFPLLMLAWKIAPSLAAGNTVVLKPAEFTSLTALRFAELCRDAGLPEGVVNIVTGDGRAGEALVAHKGVDKIAFTGSTEVGRAIRVATAGTDKALSLELGGKSPFILFDDADIDSAVEGVVDAIWFNQGQVCCAGSRLLVQENIEDAVIAKLQRRMAGLRIGDPLDKAIDMGAIVAPVQLERIKRLVQAGVDEGAAMWQPECALPGRGSFYPPTLFTNAQPASTIAREEIFGPVLVAMSFRTPAEAVALANNTAYGLAASVWSENINRALDVARQLKCGTVWVNSTNLFDAACGFGGYRESGFGREGGIEGMAEYLRPAHAAKPVAAKPVKVGHETPAQSVDRTAKNYIGGAQKRPDSGYALPVLAADGSVAGEVGQGNRKDIRDAVEAANKATGWSAATAHNRAQVLYFIAENLSAREKEFAARIRALTGLSARAARREVSVSIERLFEAAAWADKYEGRVHSPPLRDVTLAMHEPLGTIGICCPDDAPLLALVSLGAAAIAMGNRVVVVPGTAHALVATDLYQVLDTSDLPGGVLNIVTGEKDVLAKVLAEHDAVDAVWYAGAQPGRAMVEAASAHNLKRTWTFEARDWFDAAQGSGPEVLRRAVQVKNIWVPYGV